MFTKFLMSCQATRSLKVFTATVVTRQLARDTASRFYTRFNLDSAIYAGDISSYTYREVLRHNFTAGTFDLGVPRTSMRYSEDDVIHNEERNVWL